MLIENGCFHGDCIMILIDSDGLARQSKRDLLCSRFLQGCARLILVLVPYKVDFVDGILKGIIASVDFMILANFGKKVGIEMANGNYKMLVTASLHIQLEIIYIYSEDVFPRDFHHERCD